MERGRGEGWGLRHGIRTRKSDDVFLSKASRVLLLLALNGEEASDEQQADEKESCLDMPPLLLHAVTGADQVPVRSIWAFLPIPMLASTSPHPCARGEDGLMPNAATLKELARQ